MGNSYCSPQDAAHLASFAREICPFPHYNFSPHFTTMLSINSSRHLKDHYTAVQTSLTPKQLDDFTQGLRTTFGREGNVTLGGVGVVALSLAILFDTLAKQVRGQSVSESGPIPGLFVKDLRGYYPPHVYTISEYLRLVPHIANNPTRMIEAAERYLHKLSADGQALSNLGENSTLPVGEDVAQLNMVLGVCFQKGLNLHLIRIKNGTTLMDIPSQWLKTAEYTTFNLNCDPEATDKDFLAEVQKSDSRTKEAFENCKPKEDNVSGPWVKHAAMLEWVDYFWLSSSPFRNSTDDSLTAQREHFDLRANALGKWPV